MISDYLMLLTGIIEQPRGTSTLFAFVQSVWEELRVSRTLNYVDIDFVRIQSRQDMTMDLLVEGERNVIL